MTHACTHTHKKQQKAIATTRKQTAMPVINGCLMELNLGQEGIPVIS
jgi:hypothetical protein